MELGEPRGRAELDHLSVFRTDVERKRLGDGLVPGARLTGEEEHRDRGEDHEPRRDLAAADVLPTKAQPRKTATAGFTYA